MLEMPLNFLKALFQEIDDLGNGLEIVSPRLQLTCLHTCRFVFLFRAIFSDGILICLPEINVILH